MAKPATSHFWFTGGEADGMQTSIFEGDLTILMRIANVCFHLRADILVLGPVSVIGKCIL